MRLLQDFGSVVKIIIMPTIEEQTFFQGFDEGITHPEVAEILLLVNKAPKNIRDIFVKDEGGGQEGLISQNPIVLISKNKVDNISLLFHMPFCIVFCTSKDFSFSKELSKKFEVTPIICCEHKYSDILPSKITGIYSFDSLLYKKIKFLEKRFRKDSADVKFLSKLKRRGAFFKKSSWQSTLNNTTLPNEILIETLGFMLSSPKKIKEGSSRREFINYIIGSVSAYNSCLNDSNRAQSSEIIVYAPGMFSFLQHKDSELYEYLERELSQDEKRFLINGVLRNPDYSGIRISLESKYNNRSAIFKKTSVKYLSSLRRAEMRLTTAAISLLGVNKNAPSIRLPNEINHCGKYLKKLELLASASGISNPAFLKKAKAFNTVIKRIIGSKIRNYINDNYNDISLVCDIPLDWVRFTNVPVMFSHEISRINATPGNVLLQNAASFSRVMIKNSELKKILVIRSFEPDDHLKFILEKALDIFNEQMPDLICEIVDVRTKRELIDTLNQYDGYILIMDCHGNHGGDRDNGWLVIGEDKVDIWQLKDIARIPPIVILSACLTSALSGSHASVSNGFMICGALSVIGTLLPVNAIDSAVFVSRLVYRLYQFPSAIPKDYSHINLRLFLSLFLRMSYVTDLMRGFEREGYIAEGAWQNAHIEINTYINMLNNDWYDFTIKSLVTLTMLHEREVIDFIENKLFITETMCYSQIGFPESITISLQE